MAQARPAVGLLYNLATPDLVRQAPDLVEYVAVMPDGLWFDFGQQSNSQHFRCALKARWRSCSGWRKEEKCRDMA